VIPSHFGKALDESVKLIAIANNDAYGVRINHAPAAPTAPAILWTMHRPYWPHRQCTAYMAVWPGVKRGCADFKYVKCGCCCGWTSSFYPHT